MIRTLFFFLFNKKHRLTTILGCFILLISCVAHGFNMFHFPYFENDEGVYMSQAWSLVSMGKLAPYTYWYDHAPGGWIFIALWTMLTGGFYTFGFSLHSGRVFMLVLHVFSTLFVMMIAKRLTKSNTAVAVAGLCFALSPLGIYFHRRILLDNLMTFWVLLSYVLLLPRKLKLIHIISSGIAFGIAVLTKENAIFFIPGFLVTMYALAHKNHRFFGLTKWLVIMGCVVSVYFVYAMLKGELFPTGTLFGGDRPHVSLLETLRFQASRGGGSITNFNDSTFWKNTRLWASQDPLIMYGGIISTVLLTIISLLSRNKRHYLGIVVCNLFFWYFLARGGIVIEFYIVPLLPFMAISMGCVFSVVALYMQKRMPSVAHTILFSIFFFAGLFFYANFSKDSRSFPQNNSNIKTYTSDQTTPQTDAIAWMRDTIDPDSVIIIDNYGYIDLRDPKNPSGIVFPNAQWYWKVDHDDQVYELVVKKNSETIDYIAQTPQMNADLHMGNSPTTQEAISNARILKIFEKDGWGVEFWVPRLPKHILSRSWRSYTDHFILEDGRTIDPYQKNATTSEGQSYSMLRAVWMDDKETFDSVWNWTKKSLLNETGLFSWKWEVTQGTNGKVTDKGSATDADQDIAVALAFAYKLWSDDKYIQESAQIQRAVWEAEVKTVQNKPYVVAGNWAKEKSTIITNPSYFAPYAYRIFEKITPEYDWDGLITSSYEVLEKCSSSNLNTKTSAFLPPEWCEITTDGKAVVPKEQGIQNSNYEYNAVRVPFRIALDYLWNNEPRAKQYLEKLTFLGNEIDTKNKLVVSYSHDGKPLDTNDSLLAYSTVLGLFKALDSDMTKKIYSEKIFPKFYEDDKQSYFEDPGNYYTNNWAWFAVALYGNRLINVWEYPDAIRVFRM